MTTETPLLPCFCKRTPTTLMAHGFGNYSIHCECGINTGQRKGQQGAIDAWNAGRAATPPAPARKRRSIGEWYRENADGIEKELNDSEPVNQDVVEVAARAMHAEVNVGLTEWEDWIPEAQAVLQAINHTPYGVIVRERDAYKQALEFYADKKSWQNTAAYECDGDAIDDHGEKARKALAHRDKGEA